MEVRKAARGELPCPCELELDNHAYLSITDVCGFPESVSKHLALAYYHKSNFLLARRIADTTSEEEKAILDAGHAGLEKWSYRIIDETMKLNYMREMKSILQDKVSIHTCAFFDNQIAAMEATRSQKVMLIAGKITGLLLTHLQEDNSYPYQVDLCMEVLREVKVWRDGLIEAAAKTNEELHKHKAFAQSCLSGRRQCSSCLTKQD